jgi:hypothetical protein
MSKTVESFSSSKGNSTLSPGDFVDSFRIQEGFTTTSTQNNLSAIVDNIEGGHQLNPAQVNTIAIDISHNSTSEKLEYINDITTRYEDMRKEREILEQKMADITNGTTLDTHLDSEGEIYTTLFVTVFGTCILYFLFRRLYQP